MKVCYHKNMKTYEQMVGEVGADAAIKLMLQARESNDWAMVAMYATLVSEHAKNASGKWEEKR